MITLVSRAVLFILQWQAECSYGELRLNQQREAKEDLDGQGQGRPEGEKHRLVQARRPETEVWRSHC